VIRKQYTLAIWNTCLFTRSSIQSHPEWLALASGYRLNGVQLDVRGLPRAYMCSMTLTFSLCQSFSISDGQSILSDLDQSRIKRPSQVIDLLRFTMTTKYTQRSDTLRATLAVLGLHTVRYLQGIGHPPGCEDMVSALSPAKQRELSALKPNVLRANLFLRVVSESEIIPLDPDFDLTVGTFF
jgi:hypothetical protein